MTLKEYKKIEEAQAKCKHCVFLKNEGGVFYCPFSGCIEKKKKET